MNATDMTKGKPMKLLFLFSLPLMFGNVFQQLYTVVDTMIVGQTLGVSALAARDWSRPFSRRQVRISDSSALNSLSQALCMEVSLPPLETTMETFRPRLCFSAGYSMYSS